jgi:hypothetical protein
MEDEFEVTEEIEQPEVEDTEETEPEQPEESAEEVKAEEQEPEGQERKAAPAIPPKAYHVEKEKRQRLEKENQELRQKLESSAKPVKQPETLEEFFDVDPGGTLSHVDRQIKEAEAAFDTDAAQEWRNKKTDLVARGLINQQTKQTRESHVSKVNSEIYKAIPDFDAKRPELVATAIDLGLNESEAQQIMDPAIVGESASRMAKMLNRVHAIVNAGKTAKSKEVKQPTKVEAAGNGGFSNKNTTHKQLERAKASGSMDDWASLLE